MTQYKQYENPFAVSYTFRPSLCTQGDLKNCSISDNELFFHLISSLIIVFQKPHEHVVQEFHRTTKQIPEMLVWPPDRSPGLPQFSTSFEKIEWTNPPHVVLEG